MTEQEIVVHNATIIVEASQTPVHRAAYSVDETAICLGCSPDLVRALITDGTLRRIKLRGKVAIPLVAIDAMIEDLLREDACPENLPKQRGGRGQRTAAALSIVTGTADGTRR